jgi:ABC-type Na+ efflux pump permease subunit
METLLTSPVARTHLVIGKCLVVLTAALVTTLLSLLSMWASFALAKKLLFREVGKGLPFPLTMDLASLAAVFVMMLPVALFFSAIMLAIALFSPARRRRKLFAAAAHRHHPARGGVAAPGVELNSLALIPVVNVSLVCKEIFRDLPLELHSDDLGSTCVYAAALAAAVAVQAGKRLVPHVRRSGPARGGGVWVLWAAGSGDKSSRAHYRRSLFPAPFVFGLLMNRLPCKIW